MTKRQAMTKLIRAQDEVLKNISATDEDANAKWFAVRILMEAFDQVFHETNFMMEAD